MAAPPLAAHAPLLVVAHSARAIAQSAHRGGIATVALDLFADRDTQQFARNAANVACPGALTLDIERACAAAHALAADCPALVYGAGFEHQPHALARIAAGRRILGNNIECLQRINDPLAFFALLDEIGMPHPRTALQAPADPRGWLRKRRGAQGGWHVRAMPEPAPISPPQEDAYYYQQRVDGAACSALFLADAKRARILGFNQQLSIALGAAPYIYAGAVNGLALAPALHATLAAQLDSLVARAGLVGLNSLDFILSPRHYAVLEINARPSATIDLYDEDSPAGLVDWHMRACAGQLARDALADDRPVRGHAIVFAPRACRVPREFVWPSWCSDTGAPDSAIAAYAPVCSVRAAGASAEEVKRLLSERRQTLLGLLA